MQANSKEASSVKRNRKKKIHCYQKRASASEEINFSSNKQKMICVAFIIINQCRHFKIKFSNFARHHLHQGLYL